MTNDNSNRSELPGHDLEGTTVGAVTGQPCVEKDAGTIEQGIDPYDDCRATVADVRAGHTIGLDDELFQVLSRRLVSTNDLGLVSIHLESAEPDGSLGRLWVDRDPYLFDVCNSGVHAYALDSVTVIHD